jgi:alginate O-acetyltransferase complex protein AlgI
MLFNSLEFLAFAGFFFLVWRRIKHHTQARLLFIVVMSSFFYGWWNWWFLLLLYATGLLDFAAAWLMDAYPRHKGKLLFFSMGANLCNLAFFKYSGWAAENVNALFGSDLLPVVHHALPVGISFYTFHSMSYTIDVYRGHCPVSKNVLQFLATITLFPQLVAGPILRAVDILPQLLPVPETTEARRWEGMKLIAHGFFKKMVIADNLAPAVNMAFASWNSSDSSLYWWLVTTMFAFQIYCDFSGYTDIARGLAKWMGYEFKLNFDHPYRATSIRDFWGRWHISLSTWFRDYVYVPLGGSRAGPLRSHINMWITMLASGLWHGADWKFVIWGALHAAYLSIERVTSWPARLLGLDGTAEPRLLRFLRRGVVTVLILAQVWVAWVFFRADSTAQAIGIVKTMFSFSGGSSQSLQQYLFFLAIGVVYEVYMCIQPEVENAAAPTRWGGWLEPARMAFLLSCCIFLRGPGNAFIYFQF